MSVKNCEKWRLFSSDPWALCHESSFSAFSSVCFILLFLLSSFLVSKPGIEGTMYVHVHKIDHWLIIYQSFQYLIYFSCWISSTNGMIWIFIVFVVLIELVSWILKVYFAFKFCFQLSSVSRPFFLTTNLLILFTIFNSIPRNIKCIFMGRRHCYKMSKAVNLPEGSLRSPGSKLYRLIVCVVSRGILRIHVFDLVW